MMTSKKALTEKRTKKEIEELIKKAESGDAYAQCELGIKYYNGNGVPKDLNKAKFWFEKATALGDRAAMAFMEFSKTEKWGKKEKRTKISAIKKIYSEDFAKAKQGDYMSIEKMLQHLRDYGYYKQSEKWKKKILKFELPKAKRGDKQAMFRVAIYYERIDEKKHYYWIEKANEGQIFE